MCSFAGPAAIRSFVAEPRELFGPGAMKTDHARRAGQAREERALGQALQVDGDVVARLAQLVTQAQPAPHALRARPVVHAIDDGILVEERQDEIVRRPPDVRLGIGILERRREHERVHDITDRTEPNHQNARSHRGRMPTGTCLG